MIFRILKLLAWLAGGLLLLLLTLLAFNYQADIPVQELKAKYALPPSQFETLMGMDVHFRDEGPSNDSVPLVLLHGTSSSLLTWNVCAKVWSASHRVVRMDLPGFALTGPRPDRDYSIAAYVEFLDQFLTSRKITHSYLAGNSLGGLIASQYAARFPEKVRKLILIDAATYPIRNAPGTLAFRLARTPLLRNIVSVVTPFSIVRKSVEGVYGDKSRVTDELVTQYRDLTCRSGNRDALIARLNGSQEVDTTVNSKLQMPALVIWGDQDVLIPVAHAAKFHRDLPSAPKT